MVITQESIVRFWTKVDRRSDDECWLWRLKLTKHGYGRVKFNGRYVHAHRIAYELTYGVIPPGLEPDHLCRNRACSNPRHLEAVTRRENVRRGISPIARHAAATHCPQGHPYEGENLLIEISKGRIGRRCRICANARQRRYDQKIASIRRKEDSNG